MVFNSVEFAVFFPIVFIAFWLLKNYRFLQNLLLLSASLYFYFCFHYSFPIYLLFLTLISYSFSFLISRTESVKNRKVLLYTALVLLSFGLIYLKYSGLLIGNIKGLSQWQASAFNFLLPVGISFYTFSSIGYVLDIYNKKIPVEKNFITFAAYICCFPYLLIGPIASAEHLIPQFNKKPTLTMKGIDQSIGEILWGLFKKIVVADNISLGVSYCFSRQNELNGSSLLVGTILCF